MKNIKVPYIDQTGCGAFTGCESATAVMLLNYLDYNVSLDDFLDKYLDKEDFETINGELYGPDPRKVFVGNPRDTESMGCYAPVIQKSLLKIISDRYEVIDETGADLDELTEKYIQNDMPVILWATIDMKDIIIGPEWKLKDTGEVFTWRSNEHCLLLTGFDDNNYIFNDPWENHGSIAYNKELVKDRYAKQYSQALGIKEKAVG